MVGTDYFTTALGLAGLKPPADRVIDGVDVLPLLTGSANTVERKIPLYWRLNMAPPKENLHGIAPRIVAPGAPTPTPTPIPEPA